MTSTLAGHLSVFATALVLGYAHCAARFPAFAGRRIVEMAREDRVLSKIVTWEAFGNAIHTLAAIGGSTNATDEAHRTHGGVRVGGGDAPRGR